MKLYVGNLPWSVDDADLEALFSEFGSVESAAVIRDRESGRSRGFGFVEMDQAGGEKAISDLADRDVKGRTLRVNEAQPKR